MDESTGLPVDDVRVSGRQVRTLCGDWSPMTLWRYQHHPDYRHFEFPEPVAQINRRWLWRLSDIREWLKQQAPKDRPATKPLGKGVAEGSEAVAA